jgi:hypothetical protein
MQQGLNQGSDYLPLDGQSGEWRKTILELKLQVAHDSGFPYFILSSNEFRDLSSDMPMTLTDGIVGDVIANLYARDPNRRNRDWGTDPLMVQILAEMTFNPIVKRKWELWDELGQPRHACMMGAAMPIQKFAEDHPLAPLRSVFPNGIPSGNTAVVYDTSGATYWANVNLHDFRTPGYSGAWLGDDIALLLALDKLKRGRRGRG